MNCAESGIRTIKAFAINVLRKPEIESDLNAMTAMLGGKGGDGGENEIKNLSAKYFWNQVVEIYNRCETAQRPILRASILALIDRMKVLVKREVENAPEFNQDTKK